ncbi:hypothetical protein FGSG_00311 [Fusarium graminearum PH-1]|uniref:hypothetical protein n=1 Tax=Gibberella zeae (strain ATCC MYA-4620 / CBS 123657 / FGSC 9075 / NRRL 31084 / PH-1) TaxID=229533 RepID=UPI00021F1A9F|nr:hypothetical protein FGSG_00311 [Fusarium graminearum PH-1]ESU05474.1 hypothetical protein FGSG_00311 [Fusarium graminearum PH-1]|eukprot:XP_011315959.1 hypothetical protein FGSG_00311 [Fusarium graminearum PH-1]
MGYILSSAGLSKLVLAADTPGANPEHLTEHYIERTDPEIADGIRYFYCHGLAIALFFMGVISACHDHRHPATRQLFGKSCRSDPFIGEKKGCSVRYKCKCSKKDLENANLDEKPKTATAEVLELGPREKTAVADVQD